jgi:acetyl-CoA carboxylase carboxyl transferase subunit alpha
MLLAQRFGLPILTLIDTPGAYPGIGAEERGQAQAIAESLEQMASLSVPVISVVIGEGGSGGALAIGVANRILMLEYATYSVISPEGCASILFKDPGYAEQAADALRLTAKDLQELGVVDRVVEEGLGGAHRDRQAIAERLSQEIRRQLADLKRYSAVELCEDRYQKFRRLGALSDEIPGAPKRPPARPRRRKGPGKKAASPKGKDAGKRRGRSLRPVGIPDEAGT